MLDQADLKAVCTTELFERYLQLESEALLTIFPNFQRCMSGSCSSGQIHDGGDIFSCTACQYKHCMSCDVALHSGETCDLYQELSTKEKEKRKALLAKSADIEKEAMELAKRTEKEEAEAAETLKKVAKLCPGCKRKVMKTSGCDHIHCGYFDAIFGHQVSRTTTNGFAGTVCGFDFCWICLADQNEIWKVGNSAHKEDCNHFRSLPSRARVLRPDEL
ncbi:hypothetical protein LTR37_003291 [Vermiconidia calcicola]|uniref:Uncharacterized protein n=1 Tax=Vermiconidia calcicola TaxID=1690605 RepID=A0ACC3NQB5_9PEZI|nr:hypothetical protein LTR37_003291 [Vermiconidia calcicola]